MSFWTSNVEPLRQHRWFISFGPAGIEASKFAVKKMDKPKLKIGEITHKYLNHFFYYPGRVEWEAINITFAAARIIGSTSVSDQIWNTIVKAGYGIPSTGPVPGKQVSTIGKEKFKTALGTSLSLNQVDPGGNVIETWEIYNPFFTSVQFGALDYSNEDIVEVTTTIRYDYAIMNLSATTDSSGDPNTPPEGSPRW